MRLSCLLLHAGIILSPCPDVCNFKGRHVHYHCICGALVQRYERMVRHAATHARKKKYVNNFP